MYINQVPSFINLSVITEHLPDRTAKHIAKILIRVINIWKCDGFKVQTMLMDNEFNRVWDELFESIINTTAAKEHVTNIEQYIHLVKEYGRGIISILTYKKLPCTMIIHLIHFIAM